MADYAPVTKRLKKDPSPAPIIAGVVWASQSSSLVEELPAHIHPKQTSQATFFSHGADAETCQRRDSYSINQQLMNALQAIDINENDLRDEVYQELQNHHSIVFPASASGGDDPATYKEDTPDNVINEFLTSTIGMDQSCPQLRRIARGLPVTTTSLPDATVIRFEPGTSEQGNQDELDYSQKIIQRYCLMFGEFKHGPKYLKKTATVQCVLNLYAIVFWLRTKLGLPVVTVYGFAFCGHKCKDQKSQTKKQKGSYSVGLIKVSLPTTLFGEIRTESYWTRGDTNNKMPLQVLIDFLKHGNRWEFANGPRVTDASGVVPSLFMLPPQLWVDSKDRKLVLNGSMAIVFHVKKAGLLEILATAPKTTLNNFEWTAFQENAQKMANESGDEWFYVKIRARDTTLQDCPGFAMKTMWQWIEGNSNLAATYPVRPFVARNVCFVLMRDQGAALHKDSFKTVGELCFAFQAVLDTLEHLRRGQLTHGDSLEHNFVLHTDKRLRVIDLDESVAGDDELPERRVVYTAHKNRKHAPHPNWYAAMRYPNYVRGFSWEYTQIQLIAAFIKLVEWSGIDTADDNVKTQMTQLSEKALVIGTELQKRDEANEELDFGDKEPLFKNISRAYGVMKTLTRDLASNSK